MAEWFGPVEVVRQMFRRFDQYRAKCHQCPWEGGWTTLDGARAEASVHAKEAHDWDGSPG